MVGLLCWAINVIFFIQICDTELIEGGYHVAGRNYYTEEKYHERCNFWYWERCSRYSRKFHYDLRCENGWSNAGSQSECFYPICDGKIRDAACHITYYDDEIRRRDGTKDSFSGGSCLKPNLCHSCTYDGFFVDGPYCRICPRIAHCHHRRCTTQSDSHCEWCDGELVADKISWRAYIPYPPLEKKTCEKACSWRSDSTRCFPGTCDDELAARCVCMTGFGGHHCDHIVVDVEVKYAEAKLSHGTEILTTPIDPNEPGPQPIRWTNTVAWNKAEIEFHNKFPDLGKPPDIDPDGDTHFVTDLRYGIIEANMELFFERGENENFTTETRSFNCYSNENVPQGHLKCSQKAAKFVDLSSWQFRHSHRLSFKWSVRNGGYLKYLDREAHGDQTRRVSLVGRTLSRSYVFQWDLIKPYHPCVLPESGCSDPPATTTDVTEKSNVSVSWVGWTDDLSGVGHYTYEVNELKSDGTNLKAETMTMVASGTSIPAETLTVTFALTSPGMYSVTVAVYDKAQNYKATRCLVFYDDQSKVEMKSGKRTIVMESSKITNYTWVSVDNPNLNIIWTDRFINYRHKKNNWLAGVSKLTDVDPEYDDHYGTRTVDPVPNAHGIVRFEIEYKVYAPNLLTVQPFTATSGVESQKGVITVPWNNGNRLDITVKAIDIFEKFIEDTITVYKDTSPPLIENLWLSHGDDVNISVHSVDDFSKMIMEWDAMDYDSGLDQIEWRLYDNYTSDVILHGKAELHTQGMAENLTICENKYNDEPRGPACYCTMFHGCYHKHFYVIPKISDAGKHAGLVAGKDKGVHDSDYYIEVTVINNALLKTTYVKKITIDISPPHEGSVHDGIRGNPEVDYQQDLHLNAHWEGFFDRESGVEYYMYIFGDHCVAIEEFQNSTERITTYDTYASYDAPTEGRYYVSVAAVNRANEMSNVVCSDGVRVTSIIPSITELEINNARTKPRLVNDGGKIWLLDEKLKKHLIVNSSLPCSVLLTNTTGVFPVSFPSSSVDSTFCDFPSFRILAVISKTSQLKLSWKPVLPDELIHDYEVGLSSTESAFAPDIFPFKSTKHHTHFRINHPDVPDGKEFFIIVKTISKSGVEGFQTIGAFIVDTSKPLFTGNEIDVKLVDKYLIANWSHDAFEDGDDPYPLDFEYAVGSQPNTYDIKPYGRLTFGGGCKRTVQATCTAVPVTDLKWSLHSNHDYFFTIKATNLAGLSTAQTSLKYTHNTQLPSDGLVFDVHENFSASDMQSDMYDIDFTDDRRSLSLTWSQFFHPHQTVRYRVCVGTLKKTCDVVPMTTPSSAAFHTFSSLSLIPFQTYYATVEATSDAGGIMVSSDGVTVLDLNKNVTGVQVMDGTNCTGPYTMLKASHHLQDTRPTCDADADFQTSISSLSSYWTVPDSLKLFIREAFVKVEVRIVDDFWKTFLDYSYVGNHQYVKINEVNLEPGRTYRFAVKFCSEGMCFPPTYSNGLTVLVNPPYVGSLKADINNSTDRLIVVFDKMHDPDISDHLVAESVVDFYEWAIGDDMGLHTMWNAINNAAGNNNSSQVQFYIPLNSTIDFSKCRKLFIRGYNKAGVYTTTSTEIKDCVVEGGNSLLVPNIVVDAVGDQEYSLDGTIRDGFGKDISLEDKEKWMKSDADYTPYKNVLSATWDTLRHKDFTWAVIDAKNLDVTSYYCNDNKLKLRDPCSHPDAIKCGQTERTYMNAFFDSKNELVHGKRYVICLYAPRKEIKHEKWTEILNQLETCSDGVTVDLTPPTPGRVWIGVDPHRTYQISTTDVFISWDSFTDVEEFGTAVHSSGIREYMVGIGSTEGGTDITPFTPVGLVNHYTVHNLRLQDGHEYYAIVKGIDFAGRSSTVASHPIKIDSTPPDMLSTPITIKGRHLSTINAIDACWRDVFADTESGINHYLWSVGSHPGHGDIIPFTKTSLDCGVSAEDTSVDIQEGHAYYITVKAINKADLISTASSWAYIYDMSPPVSGHVYDGTSDDAPVYSKDIDHQTDTKTLSSYWEGFHDPHSTIKTYYVSIGTCPKCDDVLTNQDIGISNKFTLCHIHLGSGIRYYSTITACNTADLCTSVTSDGVIIDSSPPTQGIVLDGVDVNDIEYQSLKRYLSARWFGFTDPQSGLSHFTWRAGTRPGLDDIARLKHLPLTDILVEPNLISDLPIGKRIYVTIAAFNKAGLKTEATTNGFIVDNTPPKFTVRPYLSNDLGSIKDKSVVFKNTIRVKWGVEDQESYIQRQYLSISSHRGGYFNTSSIEINGIVREYTFSRLDLHDGGNYTVKLIACNGAQMCVEDESHGITVDSTPPTPGMFAIKTDHAADLHRHVEGWMSWSRYKLWVSWLGFSDLHTGIDKYYVSVGSQYMTDDLNKVSGHPQEFIHNHSGVVKQDEGFVQTFEVDVKNLVKLEHVFVSVWAVNQVGLPSMMINSQFKLVPGGSLEIIRRCSAITCKGHCVCAAKGQRCSLNGNKCRDISKVNDNTIIGVYDVTDVRATAPFADVKYTPSNVAMAVKWHIVQARGQEPLWYEWSAGLTQSSVIEGIFTDSDDVWHHAGQTNRAIFNLRHDKVLKEPGIAYSMVVRAWYSEDVYADFKTDGVCALSTKPSRRKIKGSAVVEQIPGNWKKDVDYIKPGAPFTITWTNVFKDDKNVIQKFKVYLSTYPGGHDIHAVELDLPGAVTSHNISRVPLTPGIVYYSNVVGYSWSGIHATETSDGIMIDSQPPVAGTVKDGIAIHDIDYQNSSRVVSASWHGFSDRDSGISHYMWCVQTISSTDDVCDIWDWENVGIQRSVSRTLNSSIVTGSEYESLVYAVDLIGHKSKTVKSNGVLIDTTHPEPTSMEHLEANIVSNPSFEDTNAMPLEWDNIANIHFCNGALNSYPTNWNALVGSCVSVLKSGKNIAMDGRLFLFLDGQISQTLFNMKVNSLYRVTFVTAHPPLLGAVLANKEGYVEIGNSRHVFMVYTRDDKHGSSSKDLNWHHHTFYFRASRSEVSFEFGSMTGNTGILFDDVKVQETEIHHHNDHDSNGKQVHAHVISLPQWSSVHASWNFMDAESPIVDYMWAIGYTEGSTEIQGFKSVGLSNFGYNYNVTLTHNSLIHITVVATNAVGLRREAHAEDLLVDLTPPEILYINDGIGSDISAQTTEEIAANWEVKDPESDLEYCEWAIGYQPYGNEIQAFQRLPIGKYTASKVFPMTQLSMQMIYVTLRCRNNAGLQSSLSTNGVKISNRPPYTTHAEVEVLTQSMTEYNTRDLFQGDVSTVRLTWTGFEDVTGIGSYLLTFESDDQTTSIKKSLTAEDQDKSFCVLQGLNMNTGNFSSTVQAVNKMYLRSLPVTSSLAVSPALPHITDNPNLMLTIDNSTITASWQNHFTSTEPMYYEVSAGTTLGGADIIQWQETKSSFLEFSLPPQIKSVRHITCYFTVRGVSANGMNSVLNAFVKLL